MGKSIKGTTKTKRGRPATTGRGTQIGMRWQEPQLFEIDAWMEKHEIATRSEAIRRLVELGLTVGAKPKQAPVPRAARAKELASKAIDKLTIGAPDDDEKASRKRRLIKGPDEFREDRVDLPKAK